VLGKIAMLGAVGVGYVLGTRAGRERYDQISAGARKLWNNPKVQDAAGKATEAAKKQGPLIQDKTKEAAHKATDQLGKSGSGGETGQADANTVRVEPVTRSLSADDDGRPGGGTHG
jgi:hypothetical protein